MGPHDLLEALGHLAPGPHLEGLVVACSTGQHLCCLPGPRHHHACMAAGFWHCQIDLMSESYHQTVGAENIVD